MDLPKETKGAGKTRKIQVVKFGQYRLDFVKHADNLYAFQLCFDAQNPFRLGSGFITMSLKTSHDYIYHISARLNVVKYDLITIFRCLVFFQLSGHRLYAHVT